MTACGLSGHFFQSFPISKARGLGKSPSIEYFCTNNHIFMHMKLSVIIVSYNVCHYLCQCLDAVWRAAQVANVETEVFVVDNHSTDGSVALLSREYASYLTAEGEGHCRLHLIANHHNAGFGRANNQALRQCTGDYILFLNPDTVIGEHSLVDCLAEAKSCPQLGAIGVKMMYPDGRFAFESRRGLPTLWVAFCKMSGLNTLFPHSRLFGRYYLRFLPEEESASIDIVSGAFMFCSRTALEHCGGFDESFFMYGEDIDLSYRFLKAGFQNRYVPTPILHYKGESTQKNSFRYVNVFYQAMLIFFRKHFPATSLLITLPVYAAIYGHAAMTLLRQQAKSLGRFLYPRRRARELSAVFVGEEADAAKLSALAETWGLQLTIASDLSVIPPAEVLILSTASCRFSEMLQAVERSSHRYQLGIFHPHRNWLILSGDVYTSAL